MNRLLMTVLAFGLMTACAQQPTTPAPTEPSKPVVTDPAPAVPVPTPVATPTPAPVKAEFAFDPAKHPVKGWHSDYDAYIKSLVTDSMVNQPAARMTRFCADWAKLSVEQKKQMYADLLFAISSPESGYNRASMYWESTMGADPVTGLNLITSEGFLQLSYQDIQGYKGCDFDYAKDKKYHLEDIANRGGRKSWSSTHANEKTILNPFINLKCGVAIVDKLTKNPKLQSVEFADLLGRYWATMRRTHKDAYQEIWGQLRKRGTPCK